MDRSVAAGVMFLLFLAWFGLVGVAEIGKRLPQGGRSFLDLVANPSQSAQKAAEERIAKSNAEFAQKVRRTWPVPIALLVMAMVILAV